MTMLAVYTWWVVFKRPLIIFTQCSKFSLIKSKILVFKWFIHHGKRWCRHKSKCPIVYFIFKIFKLTRWLYLCMFTLLSNLLPYYMQLEIKMIFCQDLRQRLKTLFNMSISYWWDEFYLSLHELVSHFRLRA